MMFWGRRGGKVQLASWVQSILWSGYGCWLPNECVKVDGKVYTLCK